MSSAKGLRSLKAKDLRRGGNVDEYFQGVAERLVAETGMGHVIKNGGRKRTMTGGSLSDFIEQLPPM